MYQCCQMCGVLSKLRYLSSGLHKPVAGFSVTFCNSMVGLCLTVLQLQKIVLVIFADFFLSPSAQNWEE